MLLISRITGDAYAPFGARTVYKGGGGRQTTVTESGIGKAYEPYIKKVLSDVTDRYESNVAGGADAIVAKMTQEQKDALAAQGQQGRDAIAGTGLYDTEGARRRDLENLLGASAGMASSAGGLGSARGEKAMMGAVADRSLALQQGRISDVQSGIQSLGEAGSTQQAYDQARLDAPDTAAQRYFGYLSGAPQTQTQTQTGGGGK